MILDVGHAAAVGPSYPGQTQFSGDCYDTVPHWVTEAQLAEKGRLFVLADAFSGQEAAESCRHAVNRLYQLYYSHPASDIRQSLQQAIRRVNNELYDEARRRQTTKSVMILAAVVYHNSLYIANVGQVRAYLWHKGQLRQVTADYPIEDATPSSDITQAISESERTKNLPENQRPMRSLGNSRQVLIDLYRQRFVPGDKLLLCTDGFYQPVQSGEIASSLQDSKVQDAADRLIKSYQEQNNTDNASVLLIAARGKGTGTDVISLFALRLFWGAAGVAILAGIVVMGTWLAPLFSPEPTLTPSPTATLTPKAATLSPALRPTPTPLPETATPTPPQTATEPPPTHTPLPTATLTTRTTMQILESPPRVIAPYKDEAVYEGDNNRLVWQWHRQLRADEIFEVRLWKDGDTPPERGTIQASSTEPRFGIPFGQTGKYFWSVAAARRTESGVELVSAWSEVYFFWWMGPRPPKPPTATPPPTPTPLP